jgi:hypothetical protein
MKGFFTREKAKGRREKGEARLAIKRASFSLVPFPLSLLKRNW